MGSAEDGDTHAVFHFWDKEKNIRVGKEQVTTLKSASVQHTYCQGPWGWNMGRTHQEEPKMLKDLEKQSL